MDICMVIDDDDNNLNSKNVFDGITLISFWFLTWIKNTLIYLKACLNGLLDDVKYFIKNEKVDINVKDENFETPLIIGKLSSRIVNNMIITLIYFCSIKKWSFWNCEFFIR